MTLLINDMGTACIESDAKLVVFVNNYRKIMHSKSYIPSIM